MEIEKHHLLLGINFKIMHNERVMLKHKFICLFFKFQYFQLCYLNIHWGMNLSVGNSVDQAFTDHKMDFGTWMVDILILKWIPPLILVFI